MIRGKNQRGQRKAIAVKTKKSISGLGYTDLQDRKIYLHKKNILSSERISIIAHEKAHIRFNDLIKSKIKRGRMRNYSNLVLKSEPFSDDLKRMRKNIKIASDRGEYIDEYYAQTKEVQQRIKDGLLQKNQLHKSFIIAENNLKALQKDSFVGETKFE